MKLPIGRTIACLIAGLFLAAGVDCLAQAHLFRIKLDQWENERPINLPD